MKFNKTAIACGLAMAFAPSAFAQQVSGVIKNSKGQPIANAKVEIVNSKKAVLTDAQGRFSFDDIKRGVVELHVSAKSYGHSNKKFNIGSDDVTNINFSLAQSVIEIIDVHATPFHVSSIESALPINVIANDELRLKHASTLGETLKNEVGIHSTYYGPVASSPIVRGMDGPRVMITQNGLDVGDASRVGPDHIVAAETATSQQVEVLRGPATLFYGSGAIGGVVNVVDTRVPSQLENSVDYMVKHNTVADENEGSVAINTFSGNMAFHLDGFWRDGDDYKIPGFAESEHAHEDDHDEDHDEDHHDEDHHDEHEENPSEYGHLPNSSSKSSGFTLGTSYILDNGFVGFSYGRMTREYGIPGHSHGGHEEEHDEDGHEEEAHEEVFADLEQDRFQFLSELTFDEGFINKVASKVAYTDYTHSEIENGAVGTTFDSEMAEARFDIYHQETSGWKGAWTFHYKDTDFAAVGAEAFTPPSETRSIALAWLEEAHINDDVLLQLGARIERVDVSGNIEMHHEEEHHEDEHDGDHDEHEHEDEHDTELVKDEQSFTPVSVSAGLVWDYEDGYNLGFSVSYAQRAPSASELYSNGPHIGTNSYEVGVLYEAHEEDGEVHFDLTDYDPEIESSFNIDLTWRKFEGDFGFVIGAFYNQASDFYYLAETGLTADDGHDHGHEDEHGDDHDDHGDEHDDHGDDHDDHGDEHDDEHSEEEGLPVYMYQQEDVTMYGIEAEFIYQASDSFKTTIFTDYIRAKLDDGGNLPRIPAMRLGGQFDYQLNNMAAQLSVTHYFDQSDVASMEEKSDSYTLVDANFNYYFDGIGEDFVLFVKGSNLTDEEARPHTSFLRDVSPLPGRGVELGIRGSF